MRDFLIVSLVLSCSFVACTGPQRNVDNKITFDTIHVVKMHYLENDSTQPSCNLRMDYIYPSAYTNSEVLLNLQKGFNNIYLEDTSYCDYPAKSAIALYVRDYVNQHDTEMLYYKTKGTVNDDDIDLNISRYDTITGHVIFNKDGILSFQVSRIVDKEGIPYSSLKNYVFDMHTGYRIDESAIFETNYADVLRPLFIAKIMQTNAVKSVDDLAELGYLDLSEINPNNNFLVDSKGVTYIFNKGEYSSLKLDEIKVFLSYSEINAALKKVSPISILIGD